MAPESLERNITKRVSIKKLLVHWTRRLIEIDQTPRGMFVHVGFDISECVND